MYLNLPTLKYHTARGDMIEVYKIVNHLYDDSVLPPLVRNMDSHTRENNFKLRVIRCKYDARKFSFCFRVVNYWNLLPDYVVNSESVNSFKNNLDKFWKRKEFYYDAEAGYSGFV